MASEVQMEACMWLSGSILMENLRNESNFDDEE